MSSTTTGISTVKSRYIKQNLFPFPAHLEGGKLSGHPFKFRHVPLLSENSSFNDYVQLLKRVSLDDYDIPLKYNPLDDYDTYVKQLDKKPSDSKEDITYQTLTFKKPDISLHNFKLCDRNHTDACEYENYTLKIDVDGQVTITAKTYIGVGYALITLQQLIEPNDEGGCIIRNLPIYIKDKPKTNYRAFMLDTARNFVRVSYILDIIQLLGFQKINYLEWHINDSQSFPLNIGTYCKQFCTTNQTSESEFFNMSGSFDYENNFWYNEVDIQTIIKTAYDYGITVVPSIDTPGHCASFKYGSCEVTKKLFGKQFQIISYSQFKFEEELNAPEPIIGFLDIAGKQKLTEVDKDTHIDRLVFIIHVLLDEIAEVFEMSEGTYGREFNLGFDEVSSKVISNEDYATYSNKLFNLFVDGTLNHKILKSSTYASTSNMTPSDWQKCNLSFWIDSTVSLNLSTKTYEDVLHLDPFQNRLRLGIWNTWPTVQIEQYKTLVKRLHNVSFVNYNSNMYYMDAGFPGANVQGRMWDYTSDNAFSYSQATYWISAVPEMAGQWGGGGLNKGWKTGFGDVYLYNFQYDFTGTSKDPSTPPLNTGFDKIPNVVGAGLACWTETVSDDRLLGQIGINLIAISEVLWKYTEEHAPDNLVHAMYRALYHIRKLKLNPYKVTDVEPIYSGENVFRSFPQGAEIKFGSPKTDDEQKFIEKNGDITQNFIDKNSIYKKWGIRIKDNYVGHVNNNLMWNINPDDYTSPSDSVKAITQYPLCKRFAYGSATAFDGKRLNPWLFKDLNTLMTNPPKTVSVVKYVYGKQRTVWGRKPSRTVRRIVEKKQIGNSDPMLGASNFSTDSKYYHSDIPYMDQRNIPIELIDIDITTPDAQHEKLRASE